MEDEALKAIDFINTFPHKFWISSWGTDDKYPAGFRYKILSVSEANDVIAFVIILQHRSGEKELLKSLETRGPDFDRVVAVFVSGLADEYNIDFEMQDFSACRTPDEFERLSREFGWISSE